MDRFVRLILVVGLLPLFSSAAVAENKQKEGEKLIQQAEQNSNIRSPDAQPFRLRASFKELGDNASGGEGTYTEIWVSRGRWRRESIVGDFHRTEVRGAKGRWLLDSAPEAPGRTGQLQNLMRIRSIHQETIKVAALRDEIMQGLPVRCIELKANQFGKETLCVDSQRGVLLESKTPTLWNGQKSENLCQYGEYGQFAGRMYPRHIQCKEGTHSGIDVRVLELASVSSPDTALFDPPAGAKELANCSSPIQAPKALYSPDPEYPKGQNQPDSSEVVSFIVGEDGKPRDLNVVISIGAPFDKAALDAVSRWIFKPAMCDADPVPVHIRVQLTFRKY